MVSSLENLMTVSEKTMWGSASALKLAARVYRSKIRVKSSGKRLVRFCSDTRRFAVPGNLCRLMSVELSEGVMLEGFVEAVLSARG